MTETKDRTELTVAQAADVLNVSVAFVLGLLDEARIPCRVDGSGRFIRKADLAVYKRADDTERTSALDELAAEAQKHGLGY